MNTLSTISLCLGIILTVFNIYVFISLRISNKKNGTNDLKEGVRALLRDKMEDKYYKHEEDKTLREYERKSVDSIYKAYKVLGGNSFVDDIYSQIREWEIKR